jgi:predicted aspartyl protease
MLRGQYDAAGRPYIEAFLRIPSLGVEGLVTFLIDTGADSTVLFPGDAKRLNISESDLSECDRDHSLGTSGPSCDYVVPAVLIVTEENGVSHAYSIELRIPEYDPELMIIPSLIGRDVLNHLSMTFDPTNKILEAEVRSSDRRFDP